MQKKHKRAEGFSREEKLESVFSPSTLDIEKRTVESVFTTERKVVRNSYLGEEPFLEVLSTDLAHIRTERIEKGIPVLDGHDWRGSVLTMLGRASDLKEVDGELRVTLRFSKKPDAEIVFRDIQDGIVDKTSIGYVVYEYEDITQEGDDMRVLKAIDWEAFEISCVPIPADIDAQIRSIKGGNMPKKKDQKREVTTEEVETLVTELIDEAKEEIKEEVKEEIKEEVLEDDTEEKEEDEDLEAKADEEDLEEKEDEEDKGQRDALIVKMCRKAGLGIAHADSLIKSGKSTREVGREIINKMSARQGASVNNHVVVDDSNKQKRMELMVEALAHKHKPGKANLSNEARAYRYMSLVEMAREITGVQKFESPTEVMKKAFHTSSDFPNLLSALVNKTIVNDYAELPQTFDPFVERTSLHDFKPKTAIKTGDFPKLQKLSEAGELKAGTMSEEAEAYKLDSYASKIRITREMIINDDLGAFLSLASKAARAGRQLESDIVWGLIIANLKMGNGNKLISAANGNMVGAGLFDAKMDEAFEKMMKQKSVDKQFIGLTPKYLVVPVALKAAAERFISTNLLATKQADVNIYGGRLEVIADPRLDDKSSSNWFLTASKDQLTMLELATLDGNGPQTNIEDIFALGMDVSVLHDVGAGLIDHRGFIGVGAFA